jgi:hypothetical protein
MSDASEPSGAHLSRSESLEDLRRRREELAKKRSRLQRYYGGALVLGVAMLVIGPSFVWGSSLRPEFVPGVVLLYTAMPWIMAPSFRMRLRDAETDLQDLDFQIDLQQFDVGKEESRAEKVLRINQLQLRRYYDMNLSQNRWVFRLGVFCVVLGVAVVAFSLYLVLRVASGTSSQIIVASLGAVGSILANFVAAVYLRMNTSASANLTDFHSRLVDTHQLLLSNLLAWRIANDEQRWHTLAELATGLTAHKHRGAA